MIYLNILQPFLLLQQMSFEYHLTITWKWKKMCRNWVESSQVIGFMEYLPGHLSRKLKKIGYIFAFSFLTYKYISSSWLLQKRKTGEPRICKRNKHEHISGMGETHQSRNMKGKKTRSHYPVQKQSKKAKLEQIWLPRCIAEERNKGKRLQPGNMAGVKNLPAENCDHIQNMTGWRQWW